MSQAGMDHQPQPVQGRLVDDGTPSSFMQFAIVWPFFIVTPLPLKNLGEAHASPRFLSFDPRHVDLRLKGIGKAAA
jgi:hypothetical protein